MILRPLKITAEMAEPVVTWMDGLHLDGPLAFGVFMGLTPSQKDRLPPLHSEWAVDFELPLARWEERVEWVDVHPRLFTEPPQMNIDGSRSGTVWGWQCSAAHAEWLLSEIHYVRKRPPTAEMSRYTTSPSVNQAGGAFKAQNKPCPSRFTRRVWWYAVGDIHRVREVLTRVPAIGKLVNHGPGKVLRWTVEEHDDWDAWRARAMPDAESGIRASIRAPYHHPSRQAPATEPIYEELGGETL